jgi:hypothetical protein
MSVPPAFIIRCLLFLLLGLFPSFLSGRDFRPEDGSTSRQELLSLCPSDVKLAFFFDGLGDEWAEWSKSRVGKYFATWGPGRAFLERFRSDIRGLESVGLGPDALASMFHGRAGFFLFNEQTSDPDHVFVFMVRDNPVFFRDFVTGIGLFAAVHAPESGLKKEYRAGVEILSLAPDIHIASDSRIVAIGRRRASVDRVLDCLTNPDRSVLADPVFMAMLSNAPAKSKQLCFARSPGLLGTAMPDSVRSVLLAGTLAPELGLRAVLAADPDSPMPASFLRSGLTTGLLSSIPHSVLYARGLDLRPDGFPDAAGLSRLLPFQEGRLQRNISAYSSFFRVSAMTNALAAAMFCRPYGQPSGDENAATNYVFVFRVRGRLSAEQYASAFWPGRTLKDGWYEKRPVVYYSERPGEDGFNYLALEGDTLLVADAFRPLAAALQARSGGGHLDPSDISAPASRDNPAAKTFLVFQTSVWAGRLWGDEKAELARAMTERSSLLRFTVSPLKSGGNGVNIDLWNIPGSTRP